MRRLPRLRLPRLLAAIALTLGAPYMWYEERKLRPATRRTALGLEPALRLVLGFAAAFGFRDAALRLVLGFAAALGLLAFGFRDAALRLVLGFAAALGLLAFGFRDAALRPVLGFAAALGLLAFGFRDAALRAFAAPPIRLVSPADLRDAFLLPDAFAPVAVTLRPPAAVRLTAANPAAGLLPAGFFFDPLGFATAFERIARRS